MKQIVTARRLGAVAGTCALTAILVVAQGGSGAAIPSVVPYAVPTPDFSDQYQIRRLLSSGERVA